MKMPKNPPFSAQSGNALWFILLAVALLAALTFAVTRSTDTTEQANITEHDTIAANEVMRTARGIEEAVSRFRINGIPENNISFYDSNALPAYSNGNCTTQDCLVFGPESERIATAVVNARAAGDALAARVNPP